MFFKTDSYIGFYIALMEQLLVTSIYLNSVFIFILLFVTLCTFVDAAVSDFEVLVDDLNAFVTAKDEDENSITSRVKLMIDSMLIEAILLHNDTLKYVKCFQQTLVYK